MTHTKKRLLKQLDALTKALQHVKPDDATRKAERIVEDLRAGVESDQIRTGRTEVVVFVRGGVVQGARANDPNIVFTLCDNDNAEAGDADEARRIRQVDKRTKDWPGIF